jgi:GTP cyclohydrolase III
MYDNQFTISNNNPTQHYQQIIKQILKQRNTAIQKENMWKYTNMTPTDTNLRATIKLQKLTRQLDQYSTLKIRSPTN